MPVADQPASPRIRTKINRLDDVIDEASFALLEQLRLGEIGIDGFQRRCLSYFKEQIDAGAFDGFIQEAMTANDQVWLLRRHVDHRRYTILLYRVDEGEVHPPHGHFNVASTQIIMKGEIVIREYERVRRDAEGRLLLQPVVERRVAAGGDFQATEFHTNVHWFHAVGGPALIFNLNARGYEDETFEAEEAGFGRRYVDPTALGSDGLAICEEFGAEEAEARFAGRPLSSFPFRHPDPGSP